MSRIVIKNIGDSKLSSGSEHKWWRSGLIVMIIISCYFILSIGLTFYQRWFLQIYKYPLSIVLCHLIFKFTVALICRKVYELVTHQKRVLLCWHNYLHQIAPTGVASGLDVGFSNWGLQLIAVSLYTMTKSTSVVFILLFSLIFQLEKKSWFVFVVVCMISGGLVMFTYKTTHFDLLGFSLVLVASFSSGLRWTLAQFVMQRSDLNMSHPIDMLYHIQPWMILSILPFALVIEGPSVIDAWVSEQSVSNQFLWGLSGGAFLACAMEFAEYMVVSKTSSLTLSIVGIVKEIVTLGLAVESENQNFTPINLLGLLICLSGVSSHVWYKSYRQYKQMANKITERNLSEPLLSEETSARFLLSSSDENEESDTEVLFNVLNSRDR